MKKIALFLLSISCTFASPKEALIELMDGNQRYINNSLEHPNRSQEQRDALLSTQSPFAVIVACSDSRVSPEILFDQGIGDLFVVRVAGNVIGPLAIDSIDYATLYLGSSIVLVMGHQNCGAIDAVIKGTTKDIESVAKLIKPAVRIAKREKSKDLLYAATVENALRMKEQLIKTKVVKKLVKEGKLEVRAAYYNMQSGAVELLD